ncbi:MAG: hypothetical protein RL557_1006 [archaeon]|jgi:Flp pilus assembly protein protease CpaA
MIAIDETIFLIVIAFVWIVGAILQDLRRREVDNIWNFSLIGFALAYRLAFSVYSNEYWFFINGVLGLLIFLVLGNLFYYSRVFAGGDAKLLIALGPIMPLSLDWIINLKIFGVFIAGFLLGGSVYVFVWSLVLVLLHFRKFSREFSKQILQNKLFVIYSVIICGVLGIASYLFFPLFYFGLLVLLFPLLLLFARAVEESCLIVSLPVQGITEGDWLYEDIFVGGRRIKANWEGVSKTELLLIQKKYRRKILVKQGIPFTPGFLIGLCVVLWASQHWGWF